MGSTLNHMDGREVHMDGREVHMDGREVHIDGRDALEGHFG
jgi:hypothetical protein